MNKTGEMACRSSFFTGKWYMAFLLFDVLDKNNRFRSKTLIFYYCFRASMDREEKAGRDVIWRRITMLEQQPIQQEMRRIIT